MATWFITDPVFLQHDTGPGHPECPARLQAVLRALEAPEFSALERHGAEAAAPDQLNQVHDRFYVEEVLAAIPLQGLRSLDPDTMVSPATGEAALKAAGALCQAVDAVATGAATRAFCAVRPPGHHAEPNRAMGFCLFNNVAVGAAHARRAHNLHHVAVVDFDVHHGNGTQAMLGPRPGFLYISTHQSPLFPGTGSRGENRMGQLLNVPLPPGTGSEAFRQHVTNEVIPALTRFQPDLIMISAGFDAHRDDPLAGMNLEDEDYFWVTEELAAVADYCCQGRMVSTLEGGYDLAALGRSTAQHVRALMD